MTPAVDWTSVPPWAVAPTWPDADLSGRYWTVVAFDDEATADVVAAWTAQIAARHPGATPRVHVVRDDVAAQHAVTADLASALVGWRLLIAGPADFCLRLRAHAVNQYVSDDEITAASTDVSHRDVHCAHCGAVTRAANVEDVVSCLGCGLDLNVHRHVSRRIGAHLGVMADADEASLVSDLELVVTAVDDRVPGIRSLSLARPDRGALPSFTPGSHLVLECGAVVNAYSLTGDGVEPTAYRISVLECADGSGGSRWMHQLGADDTVVARAPRSAFAPVLHAARHLLVAGGIGITPMVSHLRSARRWGRDVELLYVHRAGRGAHVEEIDELTDHARTFTDRGSFVAALNEALAAQPLGTHLYVCGPASFMDVVTTRAVELGWPPSRVHVERFDAAALDPGEPFEVRLRGSGDSFTVASGISLLAALQARGHDVPSLCRQGVCGQCQVTVLGGDVLHRDLYLTEDERTAGTTMMCCVSRAAGDRLELAL